MIKLNVMRYTSIASNTFRVTRLKKILGEDRAYVEARQVWLTLLGFIQERKEELGMQLLLPIIPNPLHADKEERKGLETKPAERLFT